MARAALIYPAAAVNLGGKERSKERDSNREVLKYGRILLRTNGNFDFVSGAFNLLSDAPDNLLRP